MHISLKGHLRRVFLTLTVTVGLVIFLSNFANGLAQGPDTGISGPPQFPPNKIETALEKQVTQDPANEFEFLVYLGQQVDLRTIRQAATADLQGARVYQTLWQTAQASQADILRILDAEKQAGNVDAIRSYYIVNAIYVRANGTVLRAISNRPDVAYIEAVKHIPLPEPKTGVSALASVEWGIAKIRADQVWNDYGAQGAGVVVASIDTGVLSTHSALVKQYRGTLSGSNDYNWYDPTGTFPTAPGDNNGHGTHTMGTMVGDDGANNKIGVAPKAVWIATKGCITSSCASNDLLAAAEWVLAPYPIGGTPAQGNPAMRPQIVNNSWGGAGGNLWYQAVVNAWRAAGIFPAFSAGNAGPAAGTLDSPGDYAESFSSGATDILDQIASFSAHGPSALTNEIKPDVSAPGVGVRSAFNDGGYAIFNGTSMASPHVAGCAALLKSIKPVLSISEIENAMTGSAVDLGTAGPDAVFGYGRLDCRAAAFKIAVGNDDIGDALIVNSNPYTSTIDVQYATTALDDPTFPCGSEDQGLKSVWYKITPAVSGRLDLKTAGSTYDGMVAVYQGTRGALTGIACDDDSGNYGSAVVSADLLGNTTYYVEVAQYNYENAAAKAKPMTPVGFTLNLTASFTPMTYAVSGSCVDDAGKLLKKVKIQITPEIFVKCRKSGLFSRGNLQGGPYGPLTATKKEYNCTVTPDSFTLPPSATNILVQCGRIRYPVKGHVSCPDNTGFQGVTMTAVDGAGTNPVVVQTDAQGDYAFNLISGTWKITPTFPGSSFTPTDSGTFTVNQANPNAGPFNFGASSCQPPNLLKNGNLEDAVNSAWQFPFTPCAGAITQEQSHSPTHSGRVGVVRSQDNRYCYSTMKQTVAIPANANKVTLTAWLYQVTTESQFKALAKRSEFESSDVGEAPLSSDVQYVMLYNIAGQRIKTLVWQRRNQGWNQVTFDVTEYKGWTIQVLFGVYNDGSDGYTGMYADDVLLIAE